MVLGIDISKATFDACLVTDGQTTRYHKNFRNTQSGFDELQTWLKKQEVGCLHACMEATGVYGIALAEFLVIQGYGVSIVNPTRIKRYAESRLSRIKTDKQDAFIIAQFCEKEKPAFWTPMPEELKQLQELVRRCKALKKLKQQEAGRLESILNGTIRDSVEKMVRFIEEQIAYLEAAMEEHIKQHTSLKEKVDLLTSIPGIGATTARTLLVEINFASFGSARGVAAFVGLTPTMRQSGISVNRSSRISKIGSRSARAALYMPAVVAMCHNPVIKKFAAKLLAQGKPKMAVVCAAMRKLLHIAYGVLKSGKPFDPDHADT